MMPRRIFLRLKIRLSVLLALLLPLWVAGAEPKVRGTLSTNSASVGDVVEYELIIEGELADQPPAPSVDGIEVHGPRVNRQMSFINGNVSNRLILTYSLVPKREGKFTIPALEMRVGGKVMRVLSATLTVAPGETTKETGGLAFAKILLPKQSLYVGEVMPIEVRLYLDNNARWGNLAMPPLNGDGFTARPFGSPAERDVQLSGHPYKLISFSTVIAPGKAGKVSLGPVLLNLAVSKPVRGRQRVDIFNQPIGPMFGPAEAIGVTAPDLDIEVKPLPVAGRPKDFSGAIGKFEFDATGTPGRVKVGEPVSMKLTIKGSGNFDRIGQPQLAEPDGWTTYSAKQEFNGSDSLGNEGVKTFELPVTPTVNKTTMPIFAFSFFDPVSAKYVTLKNNAAPLIVEGAPAVVVPAPVPESAKNPEPPKAEPKVPGVQDILANLPDIGRASAAFGPSVAPATFFAALFAPVPVAFLLVAWRRRRSDGKVARLASLKRERSALLSQVKNAAGRAEVLDAAVKAMRLHEQIESSGAQTEDEETALLGSRNLDAETEKALREIFSARTELLYAGAPASDRIGDTERDRVLAAVADFQRSPRK